MVINVPTPVVEGDRLFLTGFYDGSLMLRLRQDEPQVEQLWRRRGKSERDTDALHAMISTPYMEGDYVYGVDSYGELRCLDARTGDRVWEDLTATPKARWANIHMVRNGARDVDVQRAGRTDHRRALAQGIPRDQPREADRADDRATRPARRRLLVAPGLRLQARLRPQRPRVGLRQPGGGVSSSILVPTLRVGTHCCGRSASLTGVCHGRPGRAGRVGNSPYGTRPWHTHAVASPRHGKYSGTPEEPHLPESTP